MHTEITDIEVGRPAGWICFDAECRFCAANRRRWGGVFERRGFVWLPIQTAGITEETGITEGELQKEMWLKLADGSKFSGVNAWIVLMHHVWWMWPLGHVIALPGINAGARVAYRWVAQNRHCLGGFCTIQSRTSATREQPEQTQVRKPSARHQAFFQMP